MSIETSKAQEVENKPSSKAVLLFRSMFAVMCALGLSADCAGSNNSDRNQPISDTIQDDSEPSYRVVPDSTPIKRDVDNNAVEVPCDGQIA
ncbi:hypothetical protein JW758_04725 [Candidatus Peregrinibacteria bacterium]|nr:hypothetical protein [Candidatus Peregrinibacteria bacterium]